MLRFVVVAASLAGSSAARAILIPCPDGWTRVDANTPAAAVSALPEELRAAVATPSFDMVCIPPRRPDCDGCASVVASKISAPLDVTHALLPAFKDAVVRARKKLGFDAKVLSAAIDVVDRVDVFRLELEASNVNGAAYELFLGVPCGASTAYLSMSAPAARRAEFIPVFKALEASIKGPTESRARAPLADDPVKDAEETGKVIGFILSAMFAIPFFVVRARERRERRIANAIRTDDPPDAT